LSCEALQGLANRRAADPEPLTEQGFGNDRARPKPVTPSNPEELNPGLATSINKPPIRPSHPQ
jgi:hypothetical protein